MTPLGSPFECSINAVAEVICESFDIPIAQYAEVSYGVRGRVVCVCEGGGGRG